MATGKRKWDEVGAMDCLMCRQAGGILVQVVFDRYVHVLDCLPRWVGASTAQRVRCREAAEAASRPELDRAA
jgi:hypothetical protein